MSQYYSKITFNKNIISVGKDRLFSFERYQILEIVNLLWKFKYLLIPVIPIIVLMSKAFF